MDRKKLAAAAIALTFVLPSLALSADDDEAKISAQVYADLKSKGEILSTSPYYSTLNPIAARIKRIADQQYDYPFHFILVHEKNPNAFAVPGGNVYVTDSLMKFVENREELAGVLCHETSHDIHHDVVNNMRKNQSLSYAEYALGILIGHTNGIAATIISNAADIQSLTYSRQVETAADLKGSETCAQAGYNPWGMVWLFTHFQKSDSHGGMEMLSDHPNNNHRIDDLKTHFNQNPQLFSRFSSNINQATPLAGNTLRSKIIKHNKNWKFGTNSNSQNHPSHQPENYHKQFPTPPDTPPSSPQDNDVPRFP